ncbi:CHASE2 domain-containing protein [Stenomitos frigidus]|uniref:histidine kinase n=1 Tax=Stenomitos frigidus ULC18 TaxID=2107698 RepID=A0A2T1E386_9CYAN|nr:CHASE2 domain-containing protein [Stenomitos frigidus]PSB27190.1 histidine kinase [Stenomitos frigidus ULC18]
MKQSLVQHCWRFLPGGLTAAAIALLLKLGTFQSLEQIAYRHLFQARGSMPWDDRVVLVAIDDASLKQLGRFPWSRRYYTQLLNTLSSAESSVVVIDLLWSEPSAEDASLAQAMMQQGHVVLAQAWDKTGAPLLPVPELATAAIATGHVLKREEADGLVRQVDVQVNGQLALGVAAVQAYSLVQNPVSLPKLDQPFWVNWVSPASQLKSYSFVDVVQGNIPVQAFRNKIVLVGVTAAGLDPLVTPFDRSPPTGSVYLHATVVQNLLRQNALQPLQGNGLWLLLLLSAPSLSWLLSTWNTRQQLAVITGLCFGWGLLSLLLFRANYLLPIVPPMALFVTTAVSFALSDRLREDYLLRQQLAHLWKHYRKDLMINASETDHPLIPVQKQKLPQPKDAVSRVAQLAALAEQLGRAQATQATIAQTLSIGLLAADLDSIVWFCNPVAARVLQITVGSDLNEQLIPHWLSPQQWQISLKDLKAGEAVKHSHLQQGDRWFHLILQPLAYRTLTTDTHQTSKLDGFLLLLEDITEHKQTETELQRAKETAISEATRSEEANRAKSAFLTNMSHELRTPLNVILGFTQVMNHDASMSLEHQKHLEIINRSGQHLLGLINDVLEMSKIEAGRVRLNETTFDLPHLLDDLEAMLRSRASAKRLLLTFERTSALPRYITTDEGKLRQVLLNLIGNAIKFTEAGRVTLRVRSQEPGARSQELKSLAPQTTRESMTLEGAGRAATQSSPALPTAYSLVFEIEDTGPGITQEELKHLFQPFAQAKAGQQANEGSGLGLTISRTFINLMGGDVMVCSTIAQGSIFTFHIRVAHGDAITIATPLNRDRVITLAPDQCTYRILIVEDQWENSQFLVKLLVPLGFEVREARNGSEGITVWEQWQPDLILMDIRMPVIDGTEATQKIRAIEHDRETQRSGDRGDPETQGHRGDPVSSTSPLLVSPLSLPTKIIALTASVFEETEAAAVAIGCDDFLRKPIQENMLLAKLAEHLGVRYLYEASKHQEDTGSDDTTATVTTPNLHLHLVQMPPAWAEQLHQSAIRGSDRLILQLIEQIPERHAPLAHVLTDWADNFQFDEIINLTQSLLP